MDEVYTRITNGIRDAILPDATMFVKYTLGDNHTIRIKVSEGSFKPYYLKSKGLNPSGVFVRQGMSSIPASHDQIRAMIKESDGDSFESMRSMEQELTFNSAKKAFDRYNVEFAPNKYRTLGVTVRSEEMYSNLALVISDQCLRQTQRGLTASARISPSANIPAPCRLRASTTRSSARM